MKEIPLNGSPTPYVDLNEDFSGCSMTFMVDLTSVGERRTMTFRQLAPIHKVPYARIGPYKWGTVNFYGVPIFYEPNRIVIFKNVGVEKAIRSRLLDV